MQQQCSTTLNSRSYDSNGCVCMNIRTSALDQKQQHRSNVCILQIWTNSRQHPAMKDLELRTILFKEGGVDTNVVVSNEDTKGATQGCIQTSQNRSWLQNSTAAELATRPSCTTRGDQTCASRTWVKVKMESWYLVLAIKVRGLC